MDYFAPLPERRPNPAATVNAPIIRLFSQCGTGGLTEQIRWALK